jgi:cobalamin biosynthesis protein CbiD
MNLTSQAKSKHITKVIKTGKTTLTVHYKKTDNEMDEMNFHEMALEDLENLKEYLLDSRNTEETYSERGELNTKILLIDRAIVNKKQQLNG